jgi:DNA helicase-2/ATP-dependent DNA helicase PcrA
MRNRSATERMVFLARKFGWPYLALDVASKGGQTAEAGAIKAEIEILSERGDWEAAAEAARKRKEDVLHLARTLWHMGQGAEAWKIVAGVDPLPLRPWVFEMAAQEEKFMELQAKVESRLAGLTHDRKIRILEELACVAYRSGLDEDVQLLLAEGLQCGQTKNAYRARAGIGFLLEEGKDEGSDEGNWNGSIVDVTRKYIGVPELDLTNRGEALATMAKELFDRGMRASAKLLAEEAIVLGMNDQNGPLTEKAARIFCGACGQGENYTEAAKWMISVARRTNAAADWCRAGRLALRAGKHETAIECIEKSGRREELSRALAADGHYQKAADATKDPVTRAALLYKADKKLARKELTELKKDKRSQALAAILDYLEGRVDKAVEALGNAGEKETAVTLEKEDRDRWESLSVIEQLQEAAEQEAWCPKEVEPRESTLLEGVPGAGKSRKLAENVRGDVSRGMYPDQFMIITLTRSGAKVMTHRTGGDVPGKTTHSAVYALEGIAARIDGRPKLRIAPPEKALRLMEQAIFEKRSLGAAFRVLDAEEVLEDFNRTRERMDPMKVMRPTYISVCLRYMEIMDKQGLVDFPGIETNVIQLLRHNAGLQEFIRKLRIVLDEGQDYNRLDIEVLKWLIRMCGGGLDVAASPSQSIFVFRGANYGELERAMPEGIKRDRLNENKRCTPQIVQAALPLAGRDCANMFSKRENGRLVQVVETISTDLEADFVGRQVVEWLNAGRKLEEIAVLARTRRQMMPVIDALRARDIPNYMAGEKADIFSSEEVRGWAGYIELALHPENESLLETIVDVPRKGWGPKTRFTVRGNGTLTWKNMEDALQNKAHLLHEAAKEGIRNLIEMKTSLPEIAASKELSVREKAANILMRSGITETLYAEGDWESMHGLEHLEKTAEEYGSLDSFLAYLKEEIGRPREEKGVTLSTIHGSKGDEWPVVALIGVENGKLPLEGQDPAEEQRLAFVAFTRAMDELVVTATRESKPSPYLLRIPEEVREITQYP